MNGGNARSESYKKAGCCGEECCRQLFEEKNEPCWGEVTVVEEVWFGDDYSWAHACEGHAPSWDGEPYKPERGQRPHSVLFFPNGMAAVCDENGNQIPHYQGRHAHSVEALRKDGYDWTKLPDVMGRPRP